MQPPVDVKIAIESSGADNDSQSLARRLIDQQYSRVVAELGDSHAEGTALVRGLLLNRQNKSQESIGILEPLLAAIAAGEKSDVDRAARLALAEDYLRVFQYAEAAAAFSDLRQRYGDDLSKPEQDEIGVAMNVLPLMKAYPAQTVELRNFSVPFERTPAGLIELTVFVESYPYGWIFDPSAAFNTVSRSAAISMKLRFSMDTVTVRGPAGRPAKVHVSIIPLLKIQQDVFHNVAVLIYEDADLDDSKFGKKIAGVVGLPLSSAFGRVTLTANQRFEVDTGEPDKTGAHFYLEADSFYIELGTKGSERVFSLDPGLAHSTLSYPYYLEHVGELHPIDSEKRDAKGHADFRAESVTLVFGSNNTGSNDTKSNSATFREIDVMTVPPKGTVHEIYGSVGTDALEQLQTYSFDFRSMRFSVTQLE